MLFISFLPVFASAEDIPLQAVLPLYRQLQEWNFSQHPLPVPAEGIVLSRDCATWRMEAGNVWLMRPAAKGTITGLFFEGRGRFQMTIPDPTEVDQIKRFSGKDIGKNIDEPFTKLLIRTPEKFLSGLVQAPEGETYIPHEPVRQRHERWLRLAKMDVDARVMTGLLNPADEFLCIDMDTETFGWLTYIFDRFQQEEIQLQKHQEKYEYVEIWASLDRASDRKESGAPSPVRHDQIDVTHLDLSIDLTKWMLPIQSIEMDLPMTENALFRSSVTFTPLVDGDRAIRLSLHPKAKVNAVSTMEGKDLPFMRDAIGKRFYSIGSDMYDPMIHIILDEPLARGRERTIKIDYELKISNFVSGKDWYPSIIDTFNDFHTVDLTVTLNKKYDLIAVGKLQKETVYDRFKTSVWRTEVPTRIYGFTIGEKFEKEKIKLDAIPEVVSFGTTKGLITGNMVKNVAIDVAKSIHFYRWLLDVDFPLDTIYATSIRSWHGQAFDGFLHLAEYTYQSEHPGSSELFRAHEAAHQLWGHMVSWKSYRDQWLSEALAEYFAMLFIETTMSTSGYFNEILKIYTNELNGSFESSMSKFARPWDIMDIRRFREKIGPISAGFRAGTAEIPNAYYFQVYHKGPLVIHMLRIILRSTTSNDNLFREIMKDFVHTYKGKDASTEDFRTIIEKHTKSDWTWFFDQWIYGTAIPTYTWSNSMEEKADQEGNYKTVVTVSQSDVPAGFKMPIPVWIELSDKTAQQFTLVMNEPEKTFALSTKKKPKSVIFNPHYAVLAKIKKK